jgi:serine phosphatase RsbU (regulator of sigma subunit)
MGTKAKRLLYKLLVCLCAAAALTAAAGLGWLKAPDGIACDALYQRPGSPDGEIVVVGMDPRAVDEFGPMPWPRDVMAQAIEYLNNADPENVPAVIGIDVLYVGESADPDADAYLAEVAAMGENVVVASAATFDAQLVHEGDLFYMNDRAVVAWDGPFPDLADVTDTGHINQMMDDDGILRHALLWVDVPGVGRVPSFARVLYERWCEAKGLEPNPPPKTGDGFFYLPITGRPGSYYEDISVADLVEGNVPSDYYGGKIVLIGPYTLGMQDQYPTSVDHSAPMYGVEFQANVIQSLLDKNFKTEVGDIPQLIALFLICLAASILFQRWKALWGGALCLGLIIIGLGAPMLLYRWGYALHVLWLPVCVAALYILSIALHYAQAAKERRALALENERIGTELAMAARIQANSLPKEFPPFPDRKEFDIYASMTPAKKVGGDLYDFFLIDDDHLGLVIGDVSGKGVPASLFMMVATSLIRNAAMAEISPAKALTTVNAQICARNPEEMFVTVWLGVLEISTGKLTAASAGHEYPALKAPDGHFELIKDKHGFVIGGMEGIRYREYTLQMDPGAKLFVYTDGVAEATNSSEELFGTERMIDALREAEECNPQAIIESVKASVDAFVGPAPQFDDLTVLCVEYHGNNARMDQKEKEPDAAENP